MGFEEIDGTHSGWNLAQIVETVLLKYNLTHRLLSITADNASNNSTLRWSLEESLQNKSINWNADAMTVNCLAHVLNLSTKALLQKLGAKFYAGCEADDDDNNELSCSITSATESDDEIVSVEAPYTEEVGDTVQKVISTCLILNGLT